jgi:hypothetical protein
MRTEEAGAAGHQYTLLVIHFFILYESPETTKFGLEL